MDQDPHTTFDLLAREAERFDEAVAACEMAGGRLDRLDALNTAIDAAFGALELAARLRVLDPDRGAALCAVWRDVVLSVHRAERDIIDAVTA